MNPIDLLLNLLLGLAMGTVGGLFGIGGGLVAIPALGVLFGLDQQLAQGTALVMVVPNVVLALWRYHQRNRIELKHALLLSASGFACAWLASLYAVELQAERMRLAFVAFLVALALYNLARLFMRSAPVSSLVNTRRSPSGSCIQASTTMRRRVSASAPATGSSRCSIQACSGTSAAGDGVGGSSNASVSARSPTCE